MNQSFSNKISAGWLVACVLCASLLGAQPAVADWRPYTFSYGYQTARQGMFELELYTDYKARNASSSLQNQVELEYGVTNRWMVSAYGVYSGTNTSAYQYNKTKLQTRYRFGEEGQYPVDSAVYLEYKIPANGGASELEFKEILSKDFGDYNFTTNLIFEKTLADGTDWSTGYTAGFAKYFAKTLQAGLEVKGTLGTSSTLYVGPGFTTVWQNFRINLVAAAGLTAASQSLYVRNIIAYEL